MRESGVCESAASTIDVGGGAGSECTAATVASARCAGRPADLRCVDAQTRHHTALSWVEYLALDEASEERHEFIDGQVFAMGGATLRHNRIVGNAAGALDRALRGKPCVAVAGAQRIYVAATNMATYPDATVVRERPSVLPDGRTLLNPSLLVEVLSPSTADYDRGAKLRHYMRVPSFVEYLVIATDERRVEHHRRLKPGQWLMREYADETAVIALPVLDTSIVLADLYDRADELE